MTDINYKSILRQDSGPQMKLTYVSVVTQNCRIGIARSTWQSSLMTELLHLRNELGHNLPSLDCALKTLTKPNFLRRPGNIFEEKNYKGVRIISFINIKNTSIHRISVWLLLFYSIFMLTAFRLSATLPPPPQQQSTKTQGRALFFISLLMWQRAFCFSKVFSTGLRYPIIYNIMNIGFKGCGWVFLKYDYMTFREYLPTSLCCYSPSRED